MSIAIADRVQAVVCVRAPPAYCILCGAFNDLRGCVNEALGYVELVMSKPKCLVRGL